MGLRFSASSPSGPDLTSKYTFCFNLRDLDLSLPRIGVKRARERGVTLPDEPPMRGGMGQGGGGMGPGGGMGSGGRGR